MKLATKINPLSWLSTACLVCITFFSYLLAEILVTDREFVQAVVAPQSPGYYPGVPTGIGCMGYTERVHKSGGMASVHSGVKGCGQSVEFMAAGAEIMKKGWGYGTGGHSMLRRVRI